MLKWLIVLLFTIHPLFAKECPTVQEDFINFYKLPKEAPLLGLDTKVRENQKDRIVCALDSCGNRGCECALYLEIDGCFSRVLEYQGSHKILGEKEEGMFAIEVTTRGDALVPTIKKKYVWDNGRKKYVVDN